MTNQQTIDLLSKLKLYGMAKAFKGAMEIAVQDRPTAQQLVAKMALDEESYRNRKRTESLLKRCKLRYNAVLEEVICSQDRNFSKEQLLELSDCSFIERGQNILITGPTGVGKSYLASALAKHACFLGYPSRYFPMTKFIEQIAMAKVEGTLVRFLHGLEREKLLILEDVGLQPLDNNSRIAFLQILEDFYGRKAVIVTSQLPVSKWYEYINEPTIADAIMDRLTANAIRIELKGKSLRNRK